MLTIKDLIKVSDWIYEIPKSYWREMRVPCRVLASEKLIGEILDDRSLEQLINVATLPGVIKPVLAMPDAHEGYGFPVGGVAAFDIDEGIISPGGIGYDINCGVRLLKSEKRLSEVKDKLHDMARTLFEEIPSGVGRGGRLKLTERDMEGVLNEGAIKMVGLGWGKKEDVVRVESNGTYAEAEAGKVSMAAKNRGRDQLGTMGAGNHFVEVDVVEEVVDPEAAAKMGLFAGQLVVQIHTGSRGLGHQVATDYIRVMLNKANEWGITLVDRELACAPFGSQEGQDYFQAMAAAANFAWANRQVITQEVRRGWKRVFGDGELEVVWDVAHNIAKVEEYVIEGQKKRVVVHRKGATRSFPGQPVLIPGSMGTVSYVLEGMPTALEMSFGSSCHGAGRRMSRHEAKQKTSYKVLRGELAKAGVEVSAGSHGGLTEEAPAAYKDVNEVVEVIAQNGIAKKVVRLKPVVVVKG